MNTPDTAMELQHLFLELQLWRLSTMLGARIGARPRTEEEMQRHESATSALPAQASAAGVALEALVLAEKFDLSPFELDALFLAVGNEVDADFRTLRKAALRSDTPTLRVGDVLGLLMPSVSDRLGVAPMLGCRSRLVQAGLIRQASSGDVDAAFVPTRRAIAALLGLHPLDRLPPFARLRQESDDDVRSHVDADQLVELLGAGDEARCVVLYGPLGVGKTTLGRVLCGRTAKKYVEVDMAVATFELEAMAHLLVELVEDCAIAEVALLLDHTGGYLRPGSIVAHRLSRALERNPARVVIAVGNSLDAVEPSLLARATVKVNVPVPGPAVRSALWAEHLEKPPSAFELALVGEEFRLTPTEIRSAAAIVNATGVHLSEAASRQRGSGDGLVIATSARASLDSLVLPEETREEVVEFMDAARSRAVVMNEWGYGRTLSRGRGLSALFDGEAGTGKTLASEVVAVEVGIPLWRVNSATLVDKYIGETGKNLERVFEQAASRGCILLFDEADAIFGGRVDVHRSTDRYANLETGILLQLMEEHSGIVILTSNLKRGIDTAFMRRITFKVHFPEPEEPLRAKLWTQILSAEHLDSSVDIAELARLFPLTGGGIKNAVLRASYRAAAGERKISRADLVECAQLECEAMGKVVTVLT